MEKAYIFIYEGPQDQLVNELRENNIETYAILNNKLGVLYVPEDFNERRLAKIKGITTWEQSSPVSSLIQITDDIQSGTTSIGASGADYIYKSPYISSSGKEVVIASIDSGIDYLHPDFINDDGTTKIISIWDQNVERREEDDIPFGREITREEINRAIKENDDSLTQDDIGTGTISAGISCGRGALNQLYKGVAIDSELIVVKLKEYKDTYIKGRINYQSADLLAAIKYVLDVSINQGKFLIINLTVGDISTATTDLTLMDSFEFLQSPGVIVVSGAGNEGNTDIHYEGKVKNGNIIEDVLIQVGDQHALDIVLTGSGIDKISVQLISPAGELGHVVNYKPEYYPYYGTFNLENTSYKILYSYPWLQSGGEYTQIYINDIKPGVWTMRLVPEFIVGGEYDIYLPNKNLISKDTRFLDSNSYATITLYATTENVITVGCYNQKINSMWIGSSKGPVKRERIKPDIVAPGVDIIGTARGRSYNTATGTGVSSSIISGVLAIILDYIVEQKRLKRNLLYTQTLKTYLMLGDTKQDIYKYPNVSQGYGILNLQETIRQIANIVR